MDAADDENHSNAEKPTQAPIAFHPGPVGSQSVARASHPGNMESCIARRLARYTDKILFGADCHARYP